MGNPTFMKMDVQDWSWKCEDCGNAEDFEEDWVVGIEQDLEQGIRWYNLAESENIRCKRCGSLEVHETERLVKKNG